MIKINIKDETEKVLFKLFKNYKEQFIYFESDFDKKGVFWFVADVGLIDGEAKIKLDKVITKDDKGRIFFDSPRARWSLIRNLKNEWFVIGSKNKFEKFLLVDSLK